ncbi:MAG: DUF1150 family protein [Pseudomonadota bacterium]
MDRDGANAFEDGATVMSEEDLAALGGRKMVYIRRVEAEDVLTDLREEHGPNVTVELPEDGVFYAVHAADGARLALLDDRDAAFVAARQHEMEPVSVH